MSGAARPHLRHPSIELRSALFGTELANSLPVADNATTHSTQRKSKSNRKKLT